MCREVAIILKGKAIKVSKIRSTSSVWGRPDSMVVAIMKALLSYAGSLDLEYGLNFIDACVSYIINDILSSKNVLNRMPATDVLYIWFTKQR